MKLYICYPADGAPYGNSCKIFGTKKGEKPTEGWETYATVDFEPPSKFIPALIGWLNNCGLGYSDETLAETFEEESAKLIVDTFRHILDDPDFIRVAYTVRERIVTCTARELVFKPGEFAEWRRRVVLVKSP